jgi:hypothetical protein
VLAWLAYCRSGAFQLPLLLVNVKPNELGAVDSVTFHQWRPLMKPS